MWSFTFLECIEKFKLGNPSIKMVTLFIIHGSADFPEV